MGNYNGWEFGLTNDYYHKKAGGISSSNLKTILNKTGAHFLHDKLNPREATPAMNLGTLTHALILEPDSVKTDFAFMPNFESWETIKKAGFIGQNPGKIILQEKDLVKAKAMRASMMNHKTARSLLGNPSEFIAESSIFWEQGGELLKVRPDSLHRRYPFVIDLKTCRDASPKGFAKAVADYGYHLSAAMYETGVNQFPDIAESCGHSHFEAFIFVCIENTPPYAVAVYQLDPEALQRGYDLFEQALRAYTIAKSTGFTGYPDEILPLTLPGWALK